MIGSTYIDFDKATKEGKKLIRLGENPNFGLLIICGINLGLRINDLLAISFEQLKKESFDIVEGKTGKKRELQVNANIKEVLPYFENDLTYELNGQPFTSHKGSVYSVQHVNRSLNS